MKGNCFVLHCVCWFTVKSVTQNLSDGLRAVVISFAGRTYFSSVILGYMLTNLWKKSEQCSTYLHISHFLCLRLSLPYPSVRLVPAQLFPMYVCAHRGHNQVFYGRYLKKLSNKTQEALGDMTKVSISHSSLNLPRMR